ncbi:transposase zinc-binding domain-containing protein [Clostridium estertheticum]|nr:transposase zinc-binding domain-containing protein [Clostridium estertheticum]
MLGYMDVKKGYTRYICEACGEIIYIPHSCKSRTSSTCGKRHAYEWGEKIIRK